MEVKTNFLGSLYGHGASYAGAVWDKEMLCPTLTTMQGGGREPMIIVESDITHIKSRVVGIKEL